MFNAFQGRKLAIRGMMITSIILSTLACFGTMVGGEYSKVLDDKKNMKRKVMFICGFAYFLSGLFLFLFVSENLFSMKRKRL